MDAKNKTFGNRSITFSVVVLGWVLCGYLVFRYTQHKDHAGGIPDFCKAIFGGSCDELLSSSAAWHLGYPLAGWGLVYFGLLGLLFSFQRPATDRIVLLLAAFGVGISCVLTTVIIRGQHFCPLCLGIHFVNLVVLLVLSLGFRSSTSSSKQPTAARRLNVQWSALLLFAIFVGGVSEVAILRAPIGSRPPVNLDEIAKSFQDETVHTFPENDSSPLLGSTAAPVQLVVFSSFQCPACQVFASSLKNIHEKFGGSVQVTFKNFPLSSTCNPGMSQDMQPRSCDAAFAAIAAHRQNRFWDYHDHLFQSNLAADDMTLTSIARNLGLDMAKWESDRHSNDVKERVAEDMKLAYEVGITATPSVFVNGRRVSNFQETVLKFLIQNELKKVSH